MAQSSNVVQIMAQLADEMCISTAEVIEPQLDNLARDMDPAEVRGQAAAASVVMISQMAAKLDVEESPAFIRQIIMPSMVWIWNEPPHNISSVVSVIEALAQLSWLRPGDSITLPDDFSDFSPESAALMARAAIAVSARGAGIFGDPNYGDRLRAVNE